MSNGMQKVARQQSSAPIPQGAVGVIGIGGAAIRARLRGGMQTKVVMLTNSARQPSNCAGAKPTIRIAASVPMYKRWHKKRR